MMQQNCKERRDDRATLRDRHSLQEKQDAGVVEESVRGSRVH